VIDQSDTLYNTSYVDNNGRLFVHEGEYQTDTLSAQAIAQIHAAKERKCSPETVLWSPYMPIQC